MGTVVVRSSKPSGLGELRSFSRSNHSRSISLPHRGHPMRYRFSNGWATVILGEDVCLGGGTFGRILCRLPRQAGWNEVHDELAQAAPAMARDLRDP
jgi:hypothetical protein